MCKMKNDNEESRDSVMRLCCFFSNKQQLFETSVREFGGLGIICKRDSQSRCADFHV